MNVIQLSVAVCCCYYFRLLANHEQDSHTPIKDTVSNAVKCRKKCVPNETFFKPQCTLFQQHTLAGWRFKHKTQYFPIWLLDYYGGVSRNTVTIGWLVCSCWGGNKFGVFLWIRPRNTATTGCSVTHPHVF